MLISPKRAAELLGEAIEGAGSILAFARVHQLDPANLSRYRRGDMKLGGDVARAVGLQRVVLEAYVPIGTEVQPPAGWSLVNLKERGRRS